MMVSRPVPLVPPSVVAGPTSTGGNQTTSSTPAPIANAFSQLPSTTANIGANNFSVAASAIFAQQSAAAAALSPMLRMVAILQQQQQQQSNTGNLATSANSSTLFGCQPMMMTPNTVVNTSTTDGMTSFVTLANSSPSNLGTCPNSSCISTNAGGNTIMSTAFSTGSSMSFMGCPAANVKPMEDSASSAVAAAAAAAAAAVYHSSATIQSLPVSQTSSNDLLMLQKPHHQSAFRPIVPSSDSFFLSAIHSFVLNSPSEDSPSESGHLSDKYAASADDSASTATTTTLMCQVCSDRASGFHYGVFACEGCKGFFRRSIQQKIQYRPCTRAQECLIVRNNRNRCQYCRLKKCISVGMSRDAVRFGRVPKREKAKMVEEMQRTSAQSQLDAMAVQFENENEAIERIQMAFQQLVQQLEAITVSLPGKCPLQFSSYLVAIKAVVDFANAIPGFLCLNQTERIQILKSCVFDVLLVAWSNRSEFLPSFLSTSPFLVQSISNFSQRVRGLPTSALALLAAIFVIQPAQSNLDQLYQPTSSSGSPQSTTSAGTSSALVNLLSERVWLLLARIIGPLTLTLAPSLLADVRTLRAWHNEYLRPAPPAAPLTPLSLPSPPTPNTSSTLSSAASAVGCAPTVSQQHMLYLPNQQHQLKESVALPAVTVNQQQQNLTSSNNASFVLQQQQSMMFNLHKAQSSNDVISSIPASSCYSSASSTSTSVMTTSAVGGDTTSSGVCPMANRSHSDNVMANSSSSSSTSSNSSTSSWTSEAEARRSFRERHSSIASLLEKPVMPLLSPSNLSSRSEHRSGLSAVEQPSPAPAAPYA